ncbi:MAG TPA: NAD-dependent deacylase [Methylomirabilota bacterium]|jgi:NAD-dependent deacetylase|nr:NAD-dependent deacylase [Methylomirabilota bacterium]
MDDLIKRAADLVATAGPVVVFTGAGVSTESGIPDFRGPGGLWTRHDPDDFSYQRFIGSEDGRRRYWAVGRELYATVRAARPNPAHHAITALDRLGLLDCVITQNIDDLHQRAGTPTAKVIELHGNATRVRCLVCAAACTRDEIQERLETGETVPACRACGGIVKPHTILFGEPMPIEETRLAEERARAAGCFLVVGSSLVVYPAAYMPVYAKEAGARLVIVNLMPTHLDHLADAVLPGKAGEVVPRLVEEVRARVAR